MLRHQTVPVSTMACCTPPDMSYRKTATTGQTLNAMHYAMHTWLNEEALMLVFALTYVSIFVLVSAHVLGACGTALRTAAQVFIFFYLPFLYIYIMMSIVIVSHFIHFPLLKPHFLTSVILTLSYCNFIIF